MVANLAETTAILSSFWFGDILMHIVWFLPSTEGPRLDPGPKGSGHIESLAKLPSSCFYEKKDGAF